MRNWIALLTYAWSMSESVRASSQFGLKLLEVLSSSLSAEFVELFLMFLSTDFEVSSHLTPLPPTVRKLRSFDFAIKDAVFRKLRARCRDKRLPGDWPFLVNEAFFAVLGERVVALTDLGKLLPLLGSALPFGGPQGLPEISSQEISLYPFICGSLVSRGSAVYFGPWCYFGH